MAHPVTNADVAGAYRANALFDAHRDDPEFGYRFLVEEARVAGEAIVERTAWRICSALGWWSVFGKTRAKRGKKLSIAALSPAAPTRPMDPTIWPRLFTGARPELIVYEKRCP